MIRKEWMEKKRCRSDVYSALLLWDCGVKSLQSFISDEYRLLQW